MSGHHRIIVGLLVSWGIFVSGCQRGTESAVAPNGEGIFSDRWVNRSRAMIIVKLKTPALLESAVETKGGWVVDEDLRRKVEAEQEEVLEKFRALTTDIQVVYRYKWTLNGFALNVPANLLPRLRDVGGVESASKDTPMRLNPVMQAGEQSILDDVISKNPVKFIGADRVHQMTTTTATGEQVKLDGTGIRVGVIDTGIDFTHAMFGGEGTEASYKAVDPNQKPAAIYPSKKVIGGVDLVGGLFDSSSLDGDRLIPQVDENPIDESGHGTHVAGTIAGLGDGKKSFSGVAPGASLYAIKVFGKGSTSLGVLLAAFEYSADPNGDNDVSDRLDILNLSLGSPYGLNTRYEGIAIRNLTRIGTIVVNSAGNEGDHSNIVGGMSALEDAFSVAASIDDSNHNVHFPTVAFNGPGLNRLVAERIEGNISKPVSKLGAVSGTLVFAGLLADDPSEELVARLKGKVALIERGQVTFLSKLERAFKAGAIGALIYNNVEGDPVPPGGAGQEEPIGIPCVALTKETGEKLRAAMEKGDVTVDFAAPETINRPERVDTITGFSSRGPRSYDALLKPNIAAPGESIVSAAVGKGAEVVKMSGTSMAAPMVSGAMALMRQAFPFLTVKEIHNLVMGRSVPLEVPISRQGAGRVQLDRAITSPLVADRGSISLGIVQLQNSKSLREEVSFKWITHVDKARTPFTIRFNSRHAGLKMNASPVTTAADGTMSVALDFDLNAGKMSEAIEEMSGWVELVAGEEVIYRIPVLAVARKFSQVALDAVTVQADSLVGAEGALTTVQLSNRGSNAGEALLFNLLDVDGPKNNRGDNAALDACDLQAAGYRIIEKEYEEKKVLVLQVAAKIYEPESTFHRCELSVLIGDGQGDNLEAVQELALVHFDRIKGLANPQNERLFASVLMDAKRMRELRAKFEMEAKTTTKPEGPTVDYSPAVVGLMDAPTRRYTTVQYVEAPLHLLHRDITGGFSLRIATLQEETDTAEQDDFLAGTSKKWIRISADPRAQTLVGVPESVAVGAGLTELLTVRKGLGTQPVMALFPQNAVMPSKAMPDHQMMLVEPKPRDIDLGF